MQDDNPPILSTAAAPPVPHWRYPHFHSIVKAITEHVTKERPYPGQNAEVYILERGFLPEDRRWIDAIRDERMTRNSTVLYRPQIVGNLDQRIKKILASNRNRGLLVKGPQGVGKSHSLINLTRFLMGSGKFWVTIIPDCHRWESSRDFFEFLLQSVGVDSALVGLDYDAGIDPDFKKLIDDIDRVLNEKGMQWVFVFDQINAIFAQDRFQNAQDVNKLTMPFSMITRVLKPGRIISIISASANNETSHRENHEGFEAFEHPPQFQKDEIKLLYPPMTIDRWDWGKVEQMTGFVPLYLHQWAINPDNYAADVSNEIEFSLGKLERDNQQSTKIWNKFVESAIQCLLGDSKTGRPLYLDRKFSRVQKSSNKPYTYKIVSLFPLVEVEYRKFFWDVLFTYIRKREREVLVFCRSAETTKDTLGRCFEELVIARFVTVGVSPDGFRRLLADTSIAIDEGWEAELRQPADKIQLRDTCFPEGTYSERCTTYFIPLKHNFPAVDLIIRTRKIVIAIQIHTSSKDHGEVVKKLMTSIRNAGWNKEQVKKVILVYLSPTLVTKQHMEKKIERQTAPSEEDWVVPHCCTIQDFDALRNLHWDITVN